MTSSVVLRRGSLVESRHQVHVAVADDAGRILAWAGDPEIVTFFRSAAKPFQALPLVSDGVAERIGISPEELALCCASHSGEAEHVRGVRGLLEKAGVGEASLVCGPHPPMHEEAARALLRTGEEPAAVHNNCSGKHAGMLALARHHGWPLEGYHLEDHPVQQRMRGEIAGWAGMEGSELLGGEDGCGVVTFGLPLARMARAFAALGGAAGRGEEAPRAVFDAMTGHPFLASGRGRPCLRMMEAAPGTVLVKVGAEGVYCGTDRGGRTGIAIKVEDGGRRAAAVAMAEVLERLGLVPAGALESLRRPAVPNTLGHDVAFLEAEIELE